MKYPYYALLFIVVVLVSCKKEKETAEINFTIHNPHPVDVNIDLYKTEDDYDNNRNIFLSERIAASGKLEIPYASLNGNSNFYIDIYSDDFSYSNWPSGTPTLIVISPEVKYSSIYLRKSVARNVLLAKDKTQTVWKAIHARREFSNYPIWNELSEEERHVKMTITKSQDCSIIRGQQGIPTSPYMLLKIPNASEIYMDLSDELSSPLTGRISYAKGTIDTLLLLETGPNFPGVRPIYVFVRED